MVRFYTGPGDDGTTDLLGARVAKDDPRIDALGSLDEATSAIGLARSLAAEDRVREDLVAVQRDLYQIMAELAFTPELRPAVVCVCARSRRLAGSGDGRAGSRRRSAARIHPAGGIDAGCGARRGEDRNPPRRATGGRARTCRSSGEPGNPRLPEPALVTPVHRRQDRGPGGGTQPAAGQDALKRVHFGTCPANETGILTVSRSPRVILKVRFNSRCGCHTCSAGRCARRRATSSCPATV